MTNEQYQELLELFGQEQACYTSLLDLSRQQRAAIQAGEVPRLLELLGFKQSLLADVGHIEDRLSPFKQGWDSVRRSLDENQRSVLDVALQTVAELIGELIELERESEQLLAARRGESHRQLVEAARGITVNQTYSVQAPRDARYLDVRGS